MILVGKPKVRSWSKTCPCTNYSITKEVEIGPPSSEASD